MVADVHPSSKACHVAISRRGTVDSHFAPSRAACHPGPPTLANDDTTYVRTNE